MGGDDAPSLNKRTRNNEEDVCEGSHGRSDADRLEGSSKSESDPNGTNLLDTR